MGVLLSKRNSLLSRIVSFFLSLVMVIGLLSGYYPSTINEEVQAASASQYRNVLYYGEWSIYSGQNYFYPSKIDGSLITHLNFAFLDMDANGDLVLCDEHADFLAILPEQSGLTYGDPYAGVCGALSILRAKYPNMKIGISVGGWTRSGDFSAVAANASKRQNFARNIAKFVDYLGYDFVDIDWEYPTAVRASDPVANGVTIDEGCPGSEADTQNFTLLMQAIRDELDRLGNQNGKYYELSVAMSANPAMMAKIEYDKVMNIVDFANMMTYDLNGAWNAYTGHQTALYTNESYNHETQKDGQFSVDTCISYLEKTYGNRIDYSKIVIGVAPYTRGWAEVKNDGPDSKNPGLYATAKPNSVKANDGTTSGTFAYSDINKLISQYGLIEYYDETAQAAYYYSSSTGYFFTCDNERSVAAKGQYVKNKKLGGLISWMASLDSANSIAKVMYNSLYGNGYKLPEQTIVTANPNASVSISASGSQYNITLKNNEVANESNTALKDAEAFKETLTFPKLYIKSKSGATFSAGSQAGSVSNSNGYGVVDLSSVYAGKSIKQGASHTFTVNVSGTANVSDIESITMTRRILTTLPEFGTQVVYGNSGSNLPTSQMQTTTKNQNTTSAQVTTSNQVVTTHSQGSSVTGYNEWNSSSVYVGGDMVSYNGSVYKAKWWTQGENPATNPSGVWELVSGAQPTTSPKPTTVQPTTKPQVTTTNQNNNYIAYIYQDINYGGNSVGLNEGRYTLNDLVNRGAKNNDLSSIKIASGYRAVLYDDDNFKGATRVITSDTSWIGTDFNDMMSSIVIEKNTGEQVTTQGSSGGNNYGGSGKLPEHVVTGYWHNFTNGAANLKLRDVPSYYDLICVSFADSTANPGEVVFNLNSDLAKAVGGYTESEFIEDIKTIKARGQHPIISIGGAEGTTYITSSSAANNFANSLIKMIEKYGFEGVDIDLEGSAVAGTAYIAEALRKVHNHFGNDFIITMAPETYYMQNTSSTYFKLALDIKDILTIVNMQYYNSGSMIGYGGGVYSVGTVDFLTALTALLIENGLRPDQVGIGVPASSQAAGSGLVSTSTLINAVNCLTKGTPSGGSFVPPNKYPTLRGVMTWSINWDASNGYSWGKAMASAMDSLPTNGSQTPQNPTTKPQITTTEKQTTTSAARPTEVLGLTVSSVNENVVTFVWGQTTSQLVSGQSYKVYIDGSYYNTYSSASSVTYRFNSAGTHTIRVTGVLNGYETTGQTINVTLAGSTTTKEQTTTPNQSGPSTTASRLLIGYWHTWDNSGNPFIKLRDVDDDWDVINIAFAEPVNPGSTDGRMKFNISGLSAGYTKEDFKADVRTLQSRGKKVVLSIGGYEGYFSLTSQSAVNQFVNDIKSIVNEYGFDGIDIDLEQSSVQFESGNDQDINNPRSPKVVNMINAIRTIVNSYNDNFILSWAPETFYAQLGYQYYGGINQYCDSRAGVYLPMINALRNETTYVQVQLYNSSPIIGSDGVSYNMGTKEGIVAMCKMLLNGFYVNSYYTGSQSASTYFAPLRADQVVIAVPSSVSAAGSGQISNSGLQSAFTEVNSAYPGLRGIMAWSINWDSSQNNNSFANENGRYLDSLGGSIIIPPTTQPPTTQPPTYQPQTTQPQTTTVSNGSTTWKSTAVYVAGDRVTYNGVTYEAKWWTQGDIPTSEYDWGPWKKIG